MSNLMNEALTLLLGQRFTVQMRKGDWLGNGEVAVEAVATKVRWSDECGGYEDVRIRAEGEDAQSALLGLVSAVEDS